MERIVRQSLLYDFYGELLTEHQRSVYQDFAMNDMSYTEIAEEYGISRQGVYDMIKRSDKILEEYESKLGLVKRFEDTRDRISVIKKDISILREKNSDKSLDGLIEDIGSKAEMLLDGF